MTDDLVNWTEFSLLSAKTKGFLEFWVLLSLQQKVLGWYLHESGKYEIYSKTLRLRLLVLPFKNADLSTYISLLQFVLVMTFFEIDVLDESW